MQAPRQLQAYENKGVIGEQDGAARVTTDTVCAE
jgi:hypothetical protein